eukprot:COSAG05_NODE_7437_length_810_cov_35.498350_1_plen_237_part_00
MEQILPSTDWPSALLDEQSQKLVAAASTFLVGGLLAGRPDAWRRYHSAFTSTLQGYIARDLFIGGDQAPIQSTCTRHRNLCEIVLPTALSRTSDVWFGLQEVLHHGTDRGMLWHFNRQRFSVIVPAIAEDLPPASGGVAAVAEAAAARGRGGLQELLRSVDEQTLPPYEVIILASGVDDSACKTANATLQQQPRGTARRVGRPYALRMYCVETQLRQAAARNAAVKKARGDWRLSL